MNHYAKAIEILMTGDCGWRAIATEYAKKHPAEFVRACRDAELGGWKGKCLALYQAGKKVEAIRECRAATGMGLKEAKETVEGLL